MTDSKVRPAAEVAADLGRSRRLDVDSHAVSTLQRWSDAVRAEADAAGYQRAVREMKDWLRSLELLGSLHETGNVWCYRAEEVDAILAKMSRARFGDGNSGDDNI